MALPLKQKKIDAQNNAQLILSATRNWAWSIMAGSCKASRSRYVDMWNECFDQLGDKNLGLLWGSFMRHLTIEGEVKFLLGCSGCGRKTKDEAALLDCLAAHQTGNKDYAYKLVGRWFSGEAQWKADALIEAFADQLSLKGFALHSAAGERGVSKSFTARETSQKHIN